MATINGIYIFVENESVSRSSTIPQHPVEKGLPISDNVKEEPKSLSISGKIVSTANKKADTIISELENLRTGGSLIKYSGRNVVGNYMIQSFNTSHPHTIWGGADFDMELVEVRIAKSAYDPSKQKKSEEKKKVNNPTLEVGSIVVFKGGPVYVSSDAKKAAANRGRQTCRVFKISRKSWSIHQIALISTEKVWPYNVYGWVDESNIEGTGSSSGTTATKTNTSGTTNAGTQQVKQTKTTPTGDKLSNVKRRMLLK